MPEEINKEIYKRIDEERVKKALVEGNHIDAFVLFNYSSLTKEEFNIMWQQYINYGVFDEKMKEYFKQKDKLRIEKAFLDNEDEAAKFIYKTSELTEKDFNEIKRRLRVPDKDHYVSKSKTEQEIYPEDSWKQILDLISNKISKPSFDTWIKRTTAIIEKEEIKVFANNDFQRDWLDERYHNLISNIAEEVLGKEYKIVFKVQEASATN